MSWIHNPKQLAIAERDMTIARNVCRKLRKAGFRVVYYDRRDLYGARLVLANLKCGNVLILCRAIGHRATPEERQYMSVHPGSIMQLGASDVAALTAHIKRMQSHWLA